MSVSREQVLRCGKNATLRRLYSRVRDMAIVLPATGGMKGTFAFDGQQQVGVRVVSDVASQFREILVFHLGVEPVRLTDGARLKEDLGADSLDRVEIVMSCEERFDVEIPNQSADQFTTVGEAVRYLEGQVAAAAASDPVHRPANLLSALR